MSVVDELIHIEGDGTISFGNYLLDTKTKLDNVEYNGDIYKVKTFKEMTRLEKNDNFLYESEPGTAVYNMVYSENGVDFTLEAEEDAQLTLGLKEETEYEIFVDGASVGRMTTNLGGKISFSVELDANVPVKISVKQVV